MGKQGCTNCTDQPWTGNGVGPMGEGREPMQGISRNEYLLAIKRFLFGMFFAV